MNRIIHRKFAVLAHAGVGSDSPLLDLFADMPWQGWAVMAGGATIGWFAAPYMNMPTLWPVSDTVKRIGGAIGGAIFGFIGLFWFALSTTAW